MTINTEGKKQTKLLPKPKAEPRVRVLEVDDDGGFSGFVHTLRSAGLTQLSPSNSHSISDNNGGRIELGFENMVKK